MFCSICWGILAVILSIIVYIICGKEKDKYSSASELSWLTLVVKFLYKLVRNRKQGDLRLDKHLVYIAGGGDEDFSLIISPRNHTISVQDIRINAEHLQRFKSLCNYNQNDSSVPLCYAETLFIKPLIALVTSSKFCLSPLGLIHIRQTVKQYGPLEEYINAKLSLNIVVKQYRQGVHGVEVDIELRLLAADGAVCVWEGVTTLLSRSGHSKPRSKHNKEKSISYDNSDVFSVAGNCGIQYARLTSDWNPHHLFTWTSWLLGYKKPIAHGMWTLSRAIAHIQTHFEMRFDGRHELTCDFKKPLFMPSEIVIQFDDPYTASVSHCRVRVEEKESGAPHLLAVIKDI